jgi:hypothetical protein
MTKKQVTTSAALLAHVQIEGEAAPTATAVENGNTNIPKTKIGAAPATSSGPSNLFISVKTFDVEGKTVGERIVDMYHFGTRNWLQNHHWWAMHNGHCVETNVATPAEVTGYLAASKEALAAKFNTKVAA